MNLTRAEARERAALISGVSYRIALDLTSSPETFRSTTTVTFACSQPGADTFIDLVAPTVHSVVLNGAALDVAQVADGVRIALPALEATNTLEVVADCAYMNTGEGLHRFVDPADGEVYLYSQFEVADSRRVFAVFEQPSLKADFTFTITAPKHWKVFSGEVIVSTVEAPASQTVPDAVTHVFATTPRISSYITAIVAGPYEGETGELTSADGRVIPLGVYARKSLAGHLDAGEIMDVTKTGFEFFEREFGRAYPFTKYDQIFVPEFNAGAMENAGCVTHTEAYVFRSKPTQATVERRAVTVLHELAHMWFGDLVTMTWWDDLWLNESFAEFMSTLCAAEATRWADSAWTTFASLEKSWAYRQDQLPSTHPIVADMRDLEDVEVNFDGITYAKGASVLRQLVAYVGRDAFFTGVRAYFAKHAWGNTELKDFLAELAAASGRDLEAWSKLWLETAQVNLLRPVLDVADNGILAGAAIEQTAPAEYPTLRPHRLVVGGYNLRDGIMARDIRIELDVDGPMTGVTELVGREVPDVLLVNDEDLAYAKVRLDEASLEFAKANLAAFRESLPRTLIWNAAWDMTRDGEWPASNYIDLVLGNIAVESQDSTVLLVLLRQLATAVDLYTDPAGRPALKARVAASLLELARAAEPGSDAQLQFVKGLAQHATADAPLDAVADLFSGALVLDGLALDTDLRWELLAALVAGGRAGESEIDTALAADRTAGGEQAAARARAALPTPGAKDAAWDALVVGEQLPNAIQAGTIAGFVRAADPALLAPFAAKYFAMLEETWATRTNEMAVNLVNGLYPLALTGLDAGVDVIELTTQWLTEHGEKIPALVRLVSENLASAQRALVAQSVDRG